MDRGSGFPCTFRVAATTARTASTPKRGTLITASLLPKISKKKIIEGLKPDYIKGFTLLGGDPFEPENQKVLAPFLETLRKAYPEKSFWAFTGYDYEKDLLTGKLGGADNVMRMLNCLDVLVDGRFVEDLKDLNLKFRGSANQRIILLKPSLKEDKIILWDEVTIV